MNSLAAALLTGLVVTLTTVIAPWAQTFPSSENSRVGNRTPGDTSNQIRLGQPSGAGQPAQGSNLLTTITLDATLRIMRGIGFSNIEIYRSGESASIKASIDDTDTYIWHENCKNNACVTLWFAVNLGRQDAIDAAWMNDYNRNTLYTKMFTNPNDELMLTLAGSLYKGVTEDHIRSLGELWIMVFKEALEYKPKG